MTLAECHALFQLRLQEGDAERQLSFLSEEIDEYLAMAQMEALRERLPQAGSNRIIDSELAPLVLTSGLLDASPGVTPTEPVFYFPEDFAYFVRAECLLTRSLEEVEEDPSPPAPTPCVPITEDEVVVFRVRKGNDPWIPNPGVLLRDNSVVLHVDADSSVLGVRIVYVMQPARPNLAANSINDVELSLPESLHDEIVTRAVRSALVDITPKSEGP